ncbi:MAG: ATP-dependent nuclease [Bacillota bacterium]
MGAVPGEELGLGIQSAMVVGIFEAFRQLGGNFGTIIIEEPEMYLHPQAQRFFYRLLCEMTEKGQCQVIYSTHSPIFADVNRFESLRVVRREPGKLTTVAYVRQENLAELKKARNALKLGGRFDPARNEVLFARRALLVEGYGDRLAALRIELVVGVCRALNIPFIVLHDEDIWPTDSIADAAKRKKQEDTNKAAQAANERIKKAVGNSTKLFIISPSLEEVLGISRDARDKPRRIAEALQGQDIMQLPPGFVH